MIGHKLRVPLAIENLVTEDLIQTFVPIGRKTCWRRMVVRRRRFAPDRLLFRSGILPNCGRPSRGLIDQVVGCDLDGPRMPPMSNRNAAVIRTLFRKIDDVVSAELIRPYAAELFFVSRILKTVSRRLSIASIGVAEAPPPPHSIADDCEDWFQPTPSWTALNARFATSTSAWLGNMTLRAGSDFSCSTISLL